MNGNDILRAMNGLDDRFVISASREHIVKRNKPKRIAARLAVGIAAAVVFTIPAGAAYSQFVHESAVMEYFTEDSVRYIEDKGLALNISDENEHLRITLDTLLSDGNIGTLIMTVEALDDEGQSCIRRGNMPDLYVTDVQTEELLHIEEGGCWTPPDDTDPYSVKQ
ncbi:MAG: DUF4179 domain-containing protein [Ruminococcus sp.]|nr:DUF4179 domain-containing protein [Ruminococcus sp.]